jgi:CubicO group peptidase (beta-lactamase class C family)
MSVRLMTLVFLFVTAPLWAAAQSNRPDGKSAVYYPDAVWQHKTPAESGLDPARLNEATDFAVAGETKNPRDLVLNHYQTFGREPFGYAIGPIKDRGDPTGLIIHHGYIVAEWGDPLRVDMAHSVTKSMLSSVIGVAYDRGMIRNINDTVRDYVAPVQVFSPLAPGNKSDRFGASDLILPFDTPHNRTITWDHMLRQTSDWEGTLWGKPDWADRPEPNTAQWTTRLRHTPGTVYKYNDTRVNALALAALNVWRRPLPQVLKETIMDPIGASDTWRWFGYENSWVVLDGNVVQSVSGGGHWGGGMFINAYDMGRFGYLTLRHGKWKDRQLISDQWVDWALTPTPAQPNYGFMNWFLNTNRQLLPSAPASAFVHIGNGTNMVFVDPEHDLVAVARWIDGGAMDGFVKRLLASANVM